MLEGASGCSFSLILLLFYQGNYKERSFVLIFPVSLSWSSSSFLFLFPLLDATCSSLGDVTALWALRRHLGGREFLLWNSPGCTKVVFGLVHWLFFVVVIKCTWEGDEVALRLLLRCVLACGVCSHGCTRMLLLPMWLWQVTGLNVALFLILCYSQMEYKHVQDVYLKCIYLPSVVCLFGQETPQAYIGKQVKRFSRPFSTILSINTSIS